MLAGWKTRGKLSSLFSVLIFPPVESFYRLLIHKTVEEFPSLCSFSIGEGDERRTVVCFQAKILRELVERDTKYVTDSIEKVQKKVAMSQARWNSRDQDLTDRSVGRPTSGKQTGRSQRYALQQSEKMNDKGLNPGQRERNIDTHGESEKHGARPRSNRSHGRAKRPDMQVYVPRGRRSEGTKHDESAVECPTLPGKGDDFDRKQAKGGDSSGVQSSEGYHNTDGPAESDMAKKRHRERMKREPSSKSVGSTSGITDSQNRKCIGKQKIRTNEDRKGTLIVESVPTKSKEANQLLDDAKQPPNCSQDENLQRDTREENYCIQIEGSMEEDYECSGTYNMTDSAIIIHSQEDLTTFGVAETESSTDSCSTKKTCSTSDTAEDVQSSSEVPLTERIIPLNEVNKSELPTGPADAARSKQSLNAECAIESSFNSDCFKAASTNVVEKSYSINSAGNQCSPPTSFDSSETTFDEAMQSPCQITKPTLQDSAVSREFNSRDTEDAATGDEQSSNISSMTNRFESPSSTPGTSMPHSSHNSSSLPPDTTRVKMIQKDNFVAMADVKVAAKDSKHSQPPSNIGNSNSVDGEEEDNWDTLFNDDGEALDPKLMDELTAAVGKVSVQKTQFDYYNFQPKEADMNYDDYNHLIEIYDFPTEFITRDLIMAFSEFMQKGFDIKWVDDTHAIGVFSSSIAASSALKMMHPLFKVRPMSEATKATKMKAKKCTEFLQPYKARPETNASVARNLVAGALGLKTKLPREKQMQERRMLREARDKKRMASRQKKEAWEGMIGKCAMDEEN